MEILLSLWFQIKRYDSKNARFSVIGKYSYVMLHQNSDFNSICEGDEQNWLQKLNEVEISGTN